MAEAQPQAWAHADVQGSSSAALPPNVSDPVVQGSARAGGPNRGDKGNDDCGCGDDPGGLVATQGLGGDIQLTFNNGPSNASVPKNGNI